MAEDCAHLYDHLENFSDTYCKICFIPVIMCNQKQPLFDNRRTVWILFDFLTVMAVLSLGRYLRVFTSHTGELHSSGLIKKIIYILAAALVVPSLNTLPSLSPEI